MSSQISTRAIACTKFLAVVLITTTAALSTALAWDIDLSRRRKNVTKQEALPEKQMTATTDPDKRSEQNFFDAILPAGPSAQEIVILSTENGFVPKTVRVKKDTPYTVYVVNVNEKEKNVSFILDSFSEHHGTYFGKIKKFEITPKKEGIYSFLCPETSAEGRMVVYIGDAPVRGLSSQGD